MNFVDAFKMMKKGLKTTRTAWEEPEIHVWVNEYDNMVITDLTNKKRFDEDESYEVFYPNDEEYLADDWELTR